MFNPFEAIDKKMSELEKHLLDIKKLVNTPPSEEPETKYLTRQDVADMLKIDLSSVHNWTNKSILKAYQLGGRVYYKLHEIEAAIVELKK